MSLINVLHFFGISLNQNISLKTKVFLFKKSFAGESKFPLRRGKFPFSPNTHLKFVPINRMFIVIKKVITKCTDHLIECPYFLFFFCVFVFSFDFCELSFYEPATVHTVDAHKFFSIIDNRFKKGDGGRVP